MDIHEKDIVKSINLNILGTANITKACFKHSIKMIYFSTGYVYEGKKGNYLENSPVKPFNNYGLSKLGGECSVSMYSNSLILRITMTEKPFLHKSAFDNVKSNFIFHDEFCEILLKIINKRGIINIGGKSQTIYQFAKKYNINVKKVSAKGMLPTNMDMSLKKLKKIIS
jgi:dTDP-4-dehydrorhamnose reductase